MLVIPPAADSEQSSGMPLPDGLGPIWFTENQFALTSRESSCAGPNRITIEI